MSERESNSTQVELRWQPITDAPKDSEIDLWVIDGGYLFQKPARRIPNAVWKEADEDWFDPVSRTTLSDLELIATHWMPVPAAPYTRRMGDE